MMLQQHSQLGARSNRTRSRVSSAPSRARVVRVNAKLPKWDEQYDFLVNKKALKSLEPQQVKEMVDSGEWVLVDVRPPSAHKLAHPKGAINVPMYQPLDWGKPDIAKVFKFVAYSFNGVSAVEPNPDFLSQLKAATANGAKGIVTICEAGGTLKPSTNFPLGKASRSLQAAYICMSEGITDKVAHMERGVYGWYQADYDFGGEGSYQPDLGRTPMAAAEPTLQAIRAASGYSMREGDKK